MTKIKNNVICMKWGTKFGPDYVNRLYRMVEKNLTIPHNFVCFTDDSKGLDEGIKTFPLPEVVINSKEPERGWRKLGVFHKKLGNLEGTALFLDLDIIITNNINCFFEKPGDFFIMRDLYFKKVIGNSSVFRFEIGQHEDIINVFQEHHEEIKTLVRNEQAYLSYAMLEKGILDYWPSDWVVSFKQKCIYHFPLNYFFTPKLPEKTKILIFHGKPTPVQARHGYRAKFGIRNIKPTKWLDNYTEIK